MDSNGAPLPFARSQRFPHSILMPCHRICNSQQHFAAYSFAYLDMYGAPNIQTNAEEHLLTDVRQQQH